MEILASSTGSYPRVGDRPEQHRHRYAYAKWERGELSDEEFELVQQGVTREIIEEQTRAGLDVVTDGQVRWHDPISHFAKELSGCEVGGLLRFFDTNFYFRQPVIKSEVRWIKPIVVREFVLAKSVLSAPVKQVVTGPYTLARSSIDRYYGDLEALTMDFARAMAREVEELVKAGAELIQVDEPSILKHPEDLELLEAALAELAKRKGSSRLLLYTYFGAASTLYEGLRGLPVDGLGLDFTYDGDALIDAILRLGSEKELGLGLIDGRNTKMEGNEVLAVLKRIVPAIKTERVYLNPSCGLEYLPREVAFEKLRLVAAIAKKAGGSG